MSNRNFDFSAIVKILNAQNNANFYNRQQTIVQRTPGIPYTIDLQSANPQTGNYDADTIATLQAGQQAYYFKGVPDTTVLAPQQYTPLSVPIPVPPAPEVPSAPTLLVATPGNGLINIEFSQASVTPPVTNYQYSTDGGATFTTFSPAATSSPVLVPAPNGTPVTIVLRAISSTGTSVASNSLSSEASASIPTTPVLNYVLPNDNSAYVYYTWSGIISIGSAIQYSIDGGLTYTNIVGAVSPALITGLTNGVPAMIQFRYSDFTGGQSAPSNGLLVTPVPPSVADSWLEYDPDNSSSYSGSGTALANVGSYGALTGTLLNGVSYITGTGISRNVFNLNGSSQYISFGTFNFGSAITVTAWIYPTVQVSINTLLANGPPNVGSLGFKMAWNTWSSSDGAMILETGDTSSNWYVPGTVAGTITLSVWQHVTYVLDVPNRGALFFVNGVPVTNGYGLTAPNVVMNGRAFNIGAYSGGSYTPKTQLGYLKVFNSVLDASQVLADYDNSRASFGL